MASRGGRGFMKGPKKYTPSANAGKTPKTTAKAMDDELGFTSGSSSSDSEPEPEEAGSGDEDEGVSVTAYIHLQKTLARVTTERIKFADDLSKTKMLLTKSSSELDRVKWERTTHIAILKKGHGEHLGVRDGTADDLTLHIREGAEGTPGEEKAEGVAQMSDTITRISAEKMELFEQAKLLEVKHKNAADELAELKVLSAGREAKLEGDLQSLRSTVDVKTQLTAQTASTGGGASSAQVKALEAQVASLKDTIEILEAQKDHQAEIQEQAKSRRDSSGMSSAAAVKLQEELEAEKANSEKKNAELHEARAALASLQAMASSGADQQLTAKAAQAEVTSQLDGVQGELRTAKAEIEDLGAKLKSATSDAQRAEDQMASLKSSLESAASGAADSAEQLQQELASERAEHASTKDKFAEAETDLATVRAEIATVKADLLSSADAATKELREERERHVSAIQESKAEAASAVAEAKQRAEDDMKDLKARLGSFGSIVKPMAVALKDISVKYRKLRTEASELSATIAPAVKQVRRDLLKTLAEIDKQYKEMIVKYRKEMMLRKKLHNELVDLKGNIRVYGRLRPIISEDGSGAQAEVVSTHDPQDDELVHVKNKGKMSKFQLDRVFNPAESQDVVFKQMRDLIMSVVDGFNVCIFAYGQTGSGKTYSMEGNDANPGLNRRSLGALFEMVEERKADWAYELEVSVMEIYNEKLRDLLCGQKGAAAELQIKHGRAGPMVPGLTKRVVHTPEDVALNFDEAKKIRATSSTKMNDQSSRSHCLLVVYVTGTNLSTGTQTTGKLNLIDLAGSERVGKSGALDDAKRLKEATNINKSLSSLGDVIHALGAKQKHVPYRNSKLTHLLQDSLGGQAKTLMLIQLSPVQKNVGESVCTLNFGLRVRAVELGAAKKSSSSGEVAALKKRIKELEMG